MSRAEPLLTLKPRAGAHWSKYLVDSLLALGSIFLLTGLIWLFRLYQLIPDSFLVSLLAILSLASLRGLYAALLASFVAFFTFDFLFVQPLYTLNVNKFEDVLTLIVFLVTAIITSQFASMLRHRADDADRRERETHILYDLVRATNREEDLDLQLAIFVRAVVEVFAPWGIRDCLLLLPNEKGDLTPAISAVQPIEQVVLSPDEIVEAQQVMQHAHIAALSGDALRLNGRTGGKEAGEMPPSSESLRTAFYRVVPSLTKSVRMIPLKTAFQVVGVLRLSIEHDDGGETIDEILSHEQDHPAPSAVFFSTFLEQAVAVIERGHLRQQSLRMKLLQQTDTLRSALLSSVSHDLRTPLSTIKTAASSLLEEDMQWDEEAQRGFAAAISRETDRLNSLVENLLDMSRIEAGSLRPEKVWYPLDALLRDVLDQMQPLLEGRAVTLTVPDVLPPVELDTVLIEQVIINLMTNAATYTPAGSPIDVSLQREEESVIVSIADRGPGIDPSDQEHIFDTFYRVLGRKQAAGQRRGSGLGLAICRGFVEAHGGKIWIEARAGGGALFRFTLPLSPTGELEL